MLRIVELLRLLEHIGRLSARNNNDAIFIGDDGRITGIADARTVRWSADVRHIDLGGLAGLVAPLIGKQPPDTQVWVLEADAPAFIGWNNARVAIPSCSGREDTLRRRAVDAPCCPGGVGRRSTGHFSVKHLVALRKSFVPSRRHWRQLASV